MGNFENVRSFEDEKMAIYRLNLGIQNYYKVQT